MAHWWTFLTKSKSHSWQEKFMSHWWPFLTKEKSHSWQFMTIPQRRAQNIHEHLWLHWRSFLTKNKKVIQSNLWPFQARSAKTFMGIYGFIDDHFWPKRKKSFMAIFDHSQARSANTFMNIYGFIDDHFWPKRKKSFMTNKEKSHSLQFITISQREAQIHSWIFLAHWWTFLTKKLVILDIQ